VDQQLAVDIVTLAHEGLKRVTSVQRSYYHEPEIDAHAATEASAHFNFPTIKGRMFHAVNFEPITDVDLYLLRDGEPVAMFDSRWQNPYHLVSNTYGTYFFWPEPVEADHPGQEEIFAFELFAECPGFEPFRHFFSLRITAESHIERGLKGSGEYSMSDLYMLPK
jgi:competence protein ComFB